LYCITVLIGNHTASMQYELWLRCLAEVFWLTHTSIKIQEL
jgi:hypothetical protein